MKKTFTLLFFIFLGLGLQAQEYVMRVYQGGSAKTYLVQAVDSMYFYDDGFSFSLKWPLDNFKTNVLSFSTDDMNSVCTAAGTDWASMKTDFANGFVRMYGRTSDGAIDYATSATGADGFYFDASGNVCAAGAADCAFYVKVNTEGETLGFDFALYSYEDDIASSPLNANDAIAVKFYIGDSDQTAAFVITVNVTVLDAGTIVWNPSYEYAGNLVYNVKLQPNSDYSACSIPVDTAAIAAALGLADATAVLAGLEDSTVIFRGLNADGSTYEAEDPTTANNYGCWYTKTNDVTTWGEKETTPELSSYTFVESSATSGTDVFTMNVGEFPNLCSVGDTYSVKNAFIKVADGTKAVITYNITIVGE